MSDQDKDAEILALRYQIAVPPTTSAQRKVRLNPADRALLAARLQPLPRIATTNTDLAIRRRDRHGGIIHESMQTTDAGIEFAPDGGVSVGPEFRTLQAAWMEGVAAMVRTGARVIIDDVFLGGAASQQRWQEALTGLDVLWVGVRCDGTVAAGREVAWRDRIQGMAAA